jgi:hypothetical protein
MAENQIQKIGWWHERLADWMLANPQLTLGDAAKHFGCTRAWLSVVKNSDCFRIYWATRSGDYSEALVEKSTDMLMGIAEKTAGVTEMALDALAARLETTAEVMTTDHLIDITQMGHKALGYAAKANQQSPTVNVNISTGLVSAADLERAREKAMEKFGVKAETPAPAREARPAIDATYEEILEG